MSLYASKQYANLFYDKIVEDKISTYIFKNQVVI